MVEQKIRQSPRLKGYVTRRSSLWKKSGAELERIFGYKAARLAGGWALLYLKKLPKSSDWYELRGTTDLPEGGKACRADLAFWQRNNQKKTDMQKFPHFAIALAKALELGGLTATGNDRSCKVVLRNLSPGTKDYTSGSGVPQCELIKKMPLKVTAIIAPGGRDWTTDAVAAE